MIPTAMLSMIPRPLIHLAVAVALVAALLFGLRAVYGEGFDAGQVAERLAAKEAMDARQREDQRLASQLAATARAEATGWRDNAHRLQNEVRRVHQLAVACAAPAAADAGAPGGAAAPDAGAASGVAEGVPGGGNGWRLSADAVRLWDSALAGRAVPAGACGPDGTPAGACAAATAAQLEDAWANHTENAARCGADRARHRALIEFLQARQGGAAVSP